MSIYGVRAPHARHVRARLLESLRRDPAFAELRADDPSDPIVALCDAFVTLAALIDFYQQRILDEAFLASAEQRSSIELLYHSLGASFPPNAAAVTSLAYHLSDKTAGVEAVGRARAGGGAGTSPGTGGGGTSTGTGGSGGSTPPPAPSIGVSSLIPQAAQVRAVPGSEERPPTFITLEQLTALVGASRLAVAPPPDPRPPALREDTTELELAGTRTGLAVGQPIVIVAESADDERAPVRWILSLSSVVVDSKRGSTRIGWGPPLGEQVGKLADTASATVYGFAGSAALVGANATAWSSLPPAQRLAAPTATGGTTPISGGLAESRDAGGSWSARTAGVPAGAVFSALAAYGGIVLAAVASGGLLRAEGAEALAPVTLGGGARRPIAFLGGRRARMLAGGAGATVLQSIDDGRTWSPVAGGAPQLETGKSTTKEQPGAQQVRSNQLPSTMVRCVVEDANPQPTEVVAPAGEEPPALVAATDAGVYRYDGTNWSRGSLHGPVLDLLVVPASGSAHAILAATTDGVYVLGPGWQSWEQASWEPWGAARLASRVYALAQLGGRLYAATDGGVVSCSAQTSPWQPASGGDAGALPSGPVTALVAGAGVLYAATARGVYASPDGGSTWAPSDRWLAFTCDGSLQPAEDDPTPSEALRAAFAGEGIVLGGEASLTPEVAPDAQPAHPDAQPAHPDPQPAPPDAQPAAGEAPATAVADRWRLTDGARAYSLISSPAGWEVWQLAPLGPIAALGVDAVTEGTVLAAGGPLQSAADEWPGFAVGGGSVEVSPPSRTIVPASLAVLEQRTTLELCARALKVSAVEQETALRFGREGPLTRVAFDAPIPLGVFPRRSSRLWTGGAPLELFTPQAGEVEALSGKTIPLAKPLLAPVPAQRLGAVTGSPVGLATLALGGLLEMPPAGAGNDQPPAEAGGGKAPAPSRRGPIAADVLDLAVDPDDVVYLATPEGVVRVQGEAAGASQGEPAQRLLLAGWPLVSSAGDAGEAGHGQPSPAPATGVALVGTQGTTVVAASGEGLSLLAPGAKAWTPVKSPRSIALMAVSGDAVTLACEDGGAAFCEDVTATTPSWRELAPLDGPATALALDGGEVTAATATGVYRCEPGQAWRELGRAPGGETITALVRDGDGTLWGGVQSGLLRQTPGTTQWRHDPAAGGAVQALALDPLRQPLAVSATGVAHRVGGTWSELPAAPGAPVSAAAMGADQTLWVGMRAELPVELPGGGTPQPLRLEIVVPEVGLEAADVAALDQGALPAALADAIAAAGVTLAPAQTLVEGSAAGGGWVLRSETTVQLIALRGDGSRSWAVVSEPQVTLYPTAQFTSSGEVQRWPVLVEGREGAIHARPEQVVLVPADRAAPSFAENVVVSSVRTSPTAGSVLRLRQPLAHVYDPATVLVNLNVASAAQGQVVSVPIGSGDPDAIHQSFAIPSPVAAVGPTPSAPGAPLQSTLGIAVSGEPWRETASLESCGPEDRVYVAWHNADGTATVHFGDGVHGARLTLGHDNVVATYVQGGGPAGEVAPGALIQPLDRPPLVTAVHNPEPARLPPVATAAAGRVAAMHALDGLVTLGDYEDLALGQAEVTSAAAQLVGGRALVVTIAASGGASARLVRSVQASLGTKTAGGLPVRVLAARVVPVQADVEVIAADASCEDGVLGELSGLGAERPGEPLRAARVLSAATAAPGVRAAAVRRWSRPGAGRASPAAIPAAGASWPADAPAPRAAELLRISPETLRVQIAKPGVSS
ncbi:MAG TPA: hypothetical protein VMU32_12055 [Solirubrobacteraceae bacterium]|nr:hypothetical protein [Solirubrobacteraceae bacterium]